MENTALSHHGIKGQRWGIRRYQRKDGSLTKAGQRRVQKQREEALEKARQAKAEKKQLEDAKKQHEIDKQNAIKTGSASDVLKYKGELTKQEMDAAISRIRWESEMKSLSDKEVSSGKSKVDRFFDGVGDVTDKANTAFKAWNTVANIVNAFGNNDVQLPKIDTDITKGNRNQRKQEKKKAAEEAAKKKEENDSTEETSAKTDKKQKEQKSQGESSAKKDNKQQSTNSDRSSSSGSQDHTKSDDDGRSSTDTKSAKASNESSGRSAVQQYLSLPAPTSNSNVSRGSDAVYKVLHTQSDGSEIIERVDD